MKTETKVSHTPTPWNYIVSANGGKLVHVETDMNNPHGAGLPVCSIPKVREADAAHIVKCVNAHEELLETLKSLRHKEKLSPADREIIGQAIAKAESK